MEEHKDQLPLDAKLLSLAVIELNISRRNVAIYPENHPSIKSAIEKAFTHLQKLFEMRSQITLAIAKDTLIIDEYALDKKNPVYNEFATSLNQMGIASITFVAGISEEEITTFHGILVSDLDEINEAGGIEKIMKESGIRHMRIGLIDYDAFHFVEGKSEVQQDRMDVWEDYIYGLMEGKLLTEDDEKEMRGIPPKLLAEMVNRSMPETGDTETYDRVITTYLHKSSDERRLKRGALGNVMTFIEGLKPALKKQFLSGTFRNLSADPAGISKITENLSSDQLMQILSEINERDEIIPETLKNLLEKFSHVKMKASVIDTKRLSSGDGVIDDIQLSPEAIHLFEEESRFQGYVTETYRKELEKIMGVDTVQVDESTSNMINAELNEELLDGFLAHFLLELLDMDLLSGEEIDNARERLLEYVDMFLLTGQFGELTAIYDKMSDSVIREKFEELSTPMLNHLTSSEFVEDLTASYKYWGRKNREEVIEFSKRLKEIIVEPLLDALTEEDNAFLRSFYLSILAGFGEFIVPFTKKRLSDERWFVKRNMIHLLRESGLKSTLKTIKPYCEHKDIRLALEAIKGFLQFDSPDANRFIKEHLQSKKIEIRDQVIRMIGTYRVARLLPDLIKLLQKKDVLGGDYHLKIPIVQALGEIGDRRALGYLHKIVSSKSILYKKSLDQLKLAIFQSLKNYPASETKPLIEEGLHSKNDEIRETCGVLMEKIRSDE